MFRKRAAARRRIPGELIGAAVVAAIMATVLIVWEALVSEDFEVEAALVEAGGGAGVHLELEGSRELHLYVLRRDERGAQRLLFPDPARGARNPLPGGRRHRLPPPASADARGEGWPFPAAGSRDWLLLIAAVDPLKSLEDAARAPEAAGASPATGVLLPPDLLRAVGGDGDDGEGSVLRFFEDLPAGAKKQTVRRVWLRKTPLEGR